MDFRTRLLNFYQLRCPSKCADIDMLAKKYANKEKELFRQLTFKYGPEPELSSAAKAAIRERTAKKNTIMKTEAIIDYDEWMEGLLDDTDRKLLAELDKFSGKQVPKYILDQI
tara:strand:- start:376 stop:714 length:339 start_codon:yes stop_codon:yes gene_type:complete